MTESLNANFNVFRDCIAEPLVARSVQAPANIRKKRQSKGRKHEVKPLQASSDGAEKPTDDAAQLADFIDYIALELFNSLSPSLINASYSSAQNNPQLLEMARDPMPSNMADTLISTVPLSVVDSLEAYGLLSNTSGLANFLIPVFQDYVTTTTAPPPVWSNTRTDACEICDRSWIPLSYHHLIPKQVHAKVLKRGWHEEWKLNSVAWLCGACHGFVHRIAGNEELARHFWSVELLMEREDVQDWARWVGRVRWKAR